VEKAVEQAAPRQTPASREGPAIATDGYHERSWRDFDAPHIREDCSCIVLNARDCLASAPQGASFFLFFPPEWEGCAGQRAGLVVPGKFLKRPASSLFSPEKEQAITYAQSRAYFRSGEIQVFDSSGNVERLIPFTETDRRQSQIKT